MPKQRRKRSAAQRLVIAASILLVAVIAGVAAVYIRSGIQKIRSGENPYPSAVTTTSATTTATTTTTTTTTTLYPGAASRTTQTVALTDYELVKAKNAALIEVTDAGSVLLAERGADEPIPPASLTKIMTMLTFLKLNGGNSLDRTVTMDLSIINDAHAQSAACAGFWAGETCSVRDLLYGMMLPSGADAAVKLASLISGNEESFVQEMNAYAAEMGLTGTYFCNCTGLQNERHRSTVQDLARMLIYAERDPLCRTLMSTVSHTTAATAQHPNGISFTSRVFDRFSGRELLDAGYHLTVTGGKTGFTNEAGQCLATWAESTDGRKFVCVVTGCDGKKPMEPVIDTMTLYQLTERPLAQITRWEKPQQTQPAS